ncbi:MAG TPA: DUF2243 domain-containing protein [Gemmatimonadaceae bacterium]|nr:DUF2243 domain-containing protein [Gemmatimonadaceae bacterium]
MVPVTDGRARPATTSRIPGLLLGAGFGGFADGILLHQVAQWHNMGSAVLPPVTMHAMQQNMRWDGWFHLAMLVVCVAGTYLLVRHAHRGLSLPGARVFTGQLLAGWGGFNLVEGLIDHHLLDLHHVRDLPVHLPAYDWTFLAIGGVALLVLGLVLARDDQRSVA